MSIYATLWTLQFPRFGDEHHGCDWIKVRAQAVPGHIGTLLPGYGYESGDPYAAFLPPPVTSEPDHKLRAVVFVAENTNKGTARSPQEYVEPLLVLTGDEYEKISFAALRARICDALRGKQPRVIGEVVKGAGTVRILFEDGSHEDRNV
ncbi:MAG: hypothetical protein A3K19_24780 [Lentisphaerae bacterium RIFOXYB12_FULL_65_16]|nr:MAG: hypothetical protein A3K18_24195 [Lentisphaerae bacterium RIFOXYA12_64_32]OGV90687.1 MAG: hypothetical protein A3K19_24780 [Lentisphaerae bacterium RIFOXYB12_FULL_65_16]